MVTNLEPRSIDASQVLQDTVTGLEMDWKMLGLIVKSCGLLLPCVGGLSQNFVPMLASGG